MAVAAVVDERRLQRRFDPRNLGEIDVALYLLLGRGFEIELFETMAVEHHHPRLFRVGGIDEHALCHSGITPGRAAAAVRNSAGGAVPCARKPAAPELIPVRKDSVSAMADLVRGRLRVSGIRGVRRCGPARQQACCRSCGDTARCPTGRGARWADGGFSRKPIYIEIGPATMVSSCRDLVPPAASIEPGQMNLSDPKSTQEPLE